MNTISSGRRLAFISLSRQRGASLLEGIAYLGIAAIVVLGAVSLLTGAFSSAQSNRTAEEVVSIRTAVKKLYMGQSIGYGAAGTVLDLTLVQAKVLPTTLTNTGTPTAPIVSNAWGGTVSVTGNLNKFNITYTLVPQDACISVISGASGWDSIAPGAPAGGAAPANAINTFPATPLQAQGVCGAANNTITWTSL